MASLTQRRKELLDSMMREAVYEGAVAVLTEHGLNGTTMDRVAAAAGMAKGSLYNQFRGKQELLEFVHDRAVAPMQEALDEIVKGRLAAAEKLASISRLWREYLLRHHAVFEFLINDHAAKRLLRDTEQTTRASGIKQIATIIEQGVEEGAFRAVDTRAVAEMFVSASIGMVEQEFASGVPRSVDEAVDALMGVFLHGLCASEGERQTETASQES
jgi:AcrR family transcriptional regulator